MSAFLDSAHDFLAHRRIAVAGLSRTRPNPGNYIARKLRASGYQVFPIHPSGEPVDGMPAWPSLADVPGGVDGVIVTTAPAQTIDVVRDCIRAGVPRAWIHRGPGIGSMSADAVRLSEENGIALIDGGCPLMVLEPDVVHRCMRWVMERRHALPDGTRYAVGVARG